MRYLVPYTRNRTNLVGDFDRMFDEFFGRSRTLGHAPAVDIVENDDSYVLEAELTGLSEKDVDVQLNDNLLTLSSKKEEVKTEEKKNYVLKERRSSSFTRSFVVPKDVDREKIEAKFTNGVLTLTMPKTPAAKPRNIDIKAN